MLIFIFSKLNSCKTVTHTIYLQLAAGAFESIFVFMQVAEWRSGLIPVTLFVSASINSIYPEVDDGLWPEIDPDGEIDREGGTVYVQEVSTVRTEVTTLPPNRNLNKPQRTYENFDPKYNLYDTEPEPKPESGGGATGGGGGGRVTSASAQGTILVIGIIAGALIAIVLIVIIVSMRTL